MTNTRKTLGEYLSDDDPWAAVFKDVAEVACRDRLQPNLAQLTPAAQVLFDVICFDLEIVNGGFSQFFGNSTGNRVHETLAALRSIGAVLSAQLLERALDVFPGGTAPVDWRKRRELMQTFNERQHKVLDDLASIYYNSVRTGGAAGEEQEDLEALVLAFMHRHNSDPVLLRPRQLME